VFLFSPPAVATIRCSRFGLEDNLASEKAMCRVERVDVVGRRGGLRRKVQGRHHGCRGRRGSSSWFGAAALRHASVVERLFAFGRPQGRHHLENLPLDKHLFGILRIPQRLDGERGVIVVGVGKKRRCRSRGHWRGARAAPWCEHARGQAPRC